MKQKFKEIKSYILTGYQLMIPVIVGQRSVYGESAGPLSVRI